ncbi:MULTISPECIES: CocE/NonD family hydrolase [Haloferacaceae]|uniref:CocE/NonD family hydrolase n=1 Tax=Halorubrum glutamatedens TaxID=2707018 RepID=A0ABD5QRQ0_9EURY|nr:CocE/NonD family hydrolase [Halobellus captivus]
MSDSPDPKRDEIITTEQVRDAADGTTLALRVFRPNESSPNNQVPVLLQRTPYERPEFPLEELPMAALRRGYAVVYEDVRGRGASNGEFKPWVHEATDGRTAVEWITDQPWSTGNVGTFGSSSPGQVQLFTAAEQPDGLRAIAPMFTPSDLHRSDFFQDGAMSALTLISWSFGWLGPHSISRLERREQLSEDVASAARQACEAVIDDLPTFASSRPLVDLPSRVFKDVPFPSDLSAEDIVPHWSEWVNRPTYDDFWRSFDPELRYDQMDVPGLHITGWFELCQHGTITNYRGMSNATDRDQHLVVGPWSHRNTSSKIGEIDFGSHAAADEYGLVDLHLDFFDTYVRDDPSGKFCHNDPLIETYCLQPDAGSWTQHTSWPPTETRINRRYLHGRDSTETVTGGHLRETPPPKDMQPTTYQHDPDNPVPTRGGPLCCDPETATPGMFEQSAYDERNDVISFTTPRFDETTEFAGPVRASLVVSTDTHDTDFTAKLVHVTSDGRAYNLCEGIQRAQYRHGRDKSVDVLPNTPMRLTIDLWNIHHCVPAGDRLRLYVASSNFPRFDPHPGTEDPWIADESSVATQILYHETGRESYLDLPQLSVNSKSS